MKYLNFKMTAAFVAASIISHAPAVMAQSAQHVFGWAYRGDQPTVYVTETTAEFTGYTTTELKKRLTHALTREGVEAHQISASVVGTPGGIKYSDQKDANNARYEFINRERKNGKTVKVIRW